ncbi:DUF6207 family protein [Streptomyces seoulensis]
MRRHGGHLHPRPVAPAHGRCSESTWQSASGDRPARVPGEPGVRLRCYLDLRQELTAPVTAQEHHTTPR